MAISYDEFENLKIEVQNLESKWSVIRENWKLTTINEAAKIRDVTRAAILDLVKRKRIRNLKAFGNTWVLVDEVQNFKYSKPGPKGMKVDPDSKPDSKVMEADPDLESFHNFLSTSNEERE